MAEPHVISALVRKRAELAGDIENTHRRLSEMIADLEKLDATILMFDPAYEVEGIRPKAFRPPSDWSNRGEMSGTVRKILRLARQISAFSQDPPFGGYFLIAWRLLALPIPLPLAADRRGHGVANNPARERAVAFPAMIFKPSGVRGVLVKVLRRNVVMLATDHPAQAREVAFGLVGASARERVGDLVIDPV